jgi:hypothetical protein
MEQLGENQKAKMRWLNRNVAGMGFTSFLSDASHEMATAVLPAFLTSPGSSPVNLGFIEGVADAVSSSVKLGAGLSQRSRPLSPAIGDDPHHPLLFIDDWDGPVVAPEQ